MTAAGDEPVPGSEPVADVPERWEVVSSEDLHRDGWVVALRADRVRRPGDHDEEPFQRIVLEHPGASIVLAVDDTERVFCLRQYRHAAERRFVELPAGLLDHGGEAPEEVARRELAEEAGLEARTWTHLASVYSSPGISSELMHVFMARDLMPVESNGFVAMHEEADMTTEWVPFHELHAAVVHGAVQDAPLVLAVLLAHDRGLVGTGSG